MNNSINPAGPPDFSVGYNTANESMNYREPPPAYFPRVQNEENNDRPIIHQTIIVQGPLKHTPTFYICPRCQDRVMTKVKMETTQKTHMLAGFIFGMTIWCCLCCLASLPYYFKTFKQTQHYCPNCDELLGTYSKI